MITVEEDVMSVREREMPREVMGQMVDYRARRLDTITIAWASIKLSSPVGISLPLPLLGSVRSTLGIHPWLEASNAHVS